ncbi:relaxin receptor 1 [Schistocerca gregaria]|uniref:relaxin receptor 1 n=1 Tax=Schistocerca gregaria TaxID=7010 RepID=UPI00211F23A6|nr:relaxin receptor 1 [Schistocerca gregaria]
MRCGRGALCGAAAAACALLLATLLWILAQGSCSRASFACSNSSLCIPQRYMCNGHADCPDASDEDVYACADLNGYSFVNEMVGNASGAAVVLEAEGEDEEEENEESCEVTGARAACWCLGSALRCAGVGLSAVPTGLSPDLTHMVLNNNSIQVIAADAFSNYSLNVLNLDENGLEFLPPGLFDGQTQLERLYLSDNALRADSVPQLSLLSSLLWLFLDGNRLHHVRLQHLAGLRSLVWLDLSRNALTLEGEKFPELPRLKLLMLQENNIELIGEDLLAALRGLTQLNLRRNAIRSIDVNAFRNQKHLEHLDISENQLMTLQNRVFLPLGTLSRLSLGNNPVTFIPGDLFQNLTNLQSLDLRAINIENIDTTMFTLLKKLDFVYFKTFNYCKYAPTVPKCKPSTDGVSSAEHLLSRPELRASLWATAGCTAVGNALVLLGRGQAASAADNRVVSLVVRNLAASDLLMSVYLAVIGWQDVQLRGVYHRAAHSWTTSWLCTLSGMLAMTSSEVSVLIMVFMSLERFILIALPLSHSTSLAVRSAAATLALIWIAGISLAIIPAIHYRGSTRYYGINSMCFPLHIDDPFFLGWQYSAFILFGINMTGLVVMAALYTGMFISIVRTRHATPVSMQGELEFAARFFFIVVTDAACWAPLITFRALAMFSFHIPSEVYAWLVVLVLPVNSAVNPALYTFTTPRYWARLCGLVCDRRSRRRSPETQGLSRQQYAQCSHLTSLPLVKVMHEAKC